MSKKIRDNFDVRIKQPLDKRFTQENNDVNTPFQGMFKYQNSDKKYYKYIDGEYIDFFGDITELLTNSMKKNEIFVNVKDFGAKGDGTTDDTQSFQDALNFASTKGMSVIIPPCENGYFFNGTLTIPENVSLIGTSQKVQINLSFNPINNIVNTGTTLKITNTINPFITLNGSNQISGIKFYYPNQTDTNPPIVYPPTIKLIEGCGDILIENISMINTYIGIDAWTPIKSHQRLIIRNISLWPLSIGIQIDYSSDVDRIENVHIWPFWSKNFVTGTSCEYAVLHGIGIKLGRCDSIILDKIFILQMNYGIQFIMSTMGTTYGTLSNSAFESCFQSLKLDDLNAENGLNIVNCKFDIAPDAPLMNDGYSIVSSATCRGNITITNSSFWGGAKVINHIYLQSSNLNANVSNCNFYKVGDNKYIIKLLEKVNASFVNNYFGPISSGGGHFDLNGFTGTVGTIIAYNRCYGGLALFNPNNTPILGTGTNFDINQ